MLGVFVLNEERKPMQHDVKILPKYYRHLNYSKRFELRRDDRDYQVGDRIQLQEYENGVYTGRSMRFEITYVLRNCPEYGLMDGFCIIGLGDRV